MARACIARVAVALVVAAGALIASSASWHQASATRDAAGLDFSMGVNGYGGMAADTCSSAGTPTDVCTLPADGTFALSVYLNSLPAGLANGDYAGYDIFLQHIGVTPKGADYSFWPDCKGPAVLLDPTFSAVGCNVVLNDESTYTGKLAEISFTCDADGTITMVHGSASTDLGDKDKFFAEGDGTTESLTVHCVAPQPYPGDTDGDGCADANEQGANQFAGGQRNFLNPWDYFNPTHDGQIRTDDMLAVTRQYFQDKYVDPPDNTTLNPDYTEDTDRTFAGPNLWSLGPPNGQQRVDDILNATKQYFHDCA